MVSWLPYQFADDIYTQIATNDHFFGDELDLSSWKWGMCTEQKSVTTKKRMIAAGDKGQRTLFSVTTHGVFNNKLTIGQASVVKMTAL